MFVLVFKLFESAVLRFDSEQDISAARLNLKNPNTKQTTGEKQNAQKTPLQQNSQPLPIRHEPTNKRRPIRKPNRNHQRRPTTPIQTLPNPNSNRRTRNKKNHNKRIIWVYSTSSSTSSLTLTTPFFSGATFNP